MATRDSKLKALSSSSRRVRRGENDSSHVLTEGSLVSNSTASSRRNGDSFRTQSSPSKRSGELRLQAGASLPDANESFSSLGNSTKLSGSSSHKGSSRDFRSSRRAATDSKQGYRRSGHAISPGQPPDQRAMTLTPVGAVRVTGLETETANVEYTISPPPFYDADDPPDARIPSVATATAVARDDLEMEVRRQLISEAVVAQVVGIDDAEVPSSASRNEMSLKNEDQKTKSDKKSDEEETTSSLCFAFFCGVLLVGAVVVGIYFGVIRDNSASSSSALNEDNAFGPSVMPTASPTATPTEAPTSAHTPMSLFDFLSLHVPDLGEDSQAPSTMAFHWLEDAGITSDEDLVLERFVLATIYYATGGDTWHDSTGWLNNSVTACNWYPGGMCSPPDDTRYRALRTSTTTSSSASESPPPGAKIEKLAMDANNLQGTLPTEIGLLTDLTNLHVENNTGLVGTIPSEIGNMALLYEFLGGYTSLSGSLPSTLINLGNLHKFDMENAPLITGTIPLSLWTLVETLNMEGASLTGSLPQGTDGVSPEYVYLKGNKLSGSIPSDDAASWDHLEILDLRNNLLTGSIPDGFIYNLDDELVKLRLEGNYLTGTVSESLCSVLDVIDPIDRESIIFSADCLDESTLYCECCSHCCRHGENCQANSHS